MLREFEDQENLLAEMDEQVDAYRTAGKQEAAVRLEDQLLLIHQKFQELAMKFELFQKQPEAIEYEPRLARVARQLRDIKEKVIEVVEVHLLIKEFITHFEYYFQLYLTELASAEKEGIEGQLHHARCIQNALSDIKAEIGNLIKIGRRILDHETFERKIELKEKIDALEQDYHDAGCEVILATRKLNEALANAEKLQSLTTTLDHWLSSKLVEVGQVEENVGAFVKQTVQEMLDKRETYEEIGKINANFFQHCNPALLTTLKESMASIDDKWGQVHEALSVKLTLLRKNPSSPGDETEMGQLSDQLDDLKLSEKRKLSSMSQDNHDVPLLDEFRTAFQEVSVWINKAEAQLNTNRESQERQVGQEIDDWARAKMSNLRQMAEKLVQLFVNDCNDVEPEMASLHLRWQHIVKEVEKRLRANQAFRMVEVEEIKTTISHLSITTRTDPIPSTTSIVSPSSAQDYPDEEIETLIEDEEHSPSNPGSKIRFTSHLVNSSDSISSEHLQKPLESINTCKKTPPDPLPKPKWYLDQRAQGIKNPISPEKVKVVQNTLPSPQKLVGRVEKSKADQVGQKFPEKTIVMSSATTTPSSTPSMSIFK